MRAKKLIIVLFWQAKLKTTEAYISELWHTHSRELYIIYGNADYTMLGDKSNVKTVYIILSLPYENYGYV